MDKQKLLGIILKDLEELKILSEEIALAEHDSALIIDLALSKARLVVQEIDLLHEYTPASEKKTEARGSNDGQKDLEEQPVADYPEPDLEILQFEASDERHVPAAAATPETELPEAANEPGAKEESRNEPEPLTNPDGEAAPARKPDQEPADQEQLLEEASEEEEEDEEENVVYREDGDDTPEDDLDDGDEPEIEINELEDGIQSSVREIHIEELDDEEAGSFKFAPAGKPQERPSFHEIPKPESAPAEKQIIGEKFKKEPSFNDSMAEKRSVESKLTNGPISSLRASIGINDRFLFIREIFENNAEKYNTIIDHLDKLETIQQAVEYLKANLTMEKNDTSMKFVDLLKRRFTR
jgi:hypothetical protein